MTSLCRRTCKDVFSPKILLLQHLNPAQVVWISLSFPSTPFLVSFHKWGMQRGKELLLINRLLAYQYITSLINYHHKTSVSAMAKNAEGNQAGKYFPLCVPTSYPDRVTGSLNNEVRATEESSASRRVREILSLSSL